MWLMKYVFLHVYLWKTFKYEDINWLVYLARAENNNSNQSSKLLGLLFIQILNKYFILE